MRPHFYKNESYKWLIKWVSKIEYRSGKMCQFVTPYTSYISAECHQYRWRHITFFGVTKIQVEMVTNVKSSKWNWLYRQIKRSLVVRLDVNRHMTHIDDSSLWIILWVAVIVNLETLLKNKMNLETRLLCLIHKSTLKRHY